MKIFFVACGILIYTLFLAQRCFGQITGSTISNSNANGSQSTAITSTGGAMTMVNMNKADLGIKGSRYLYPVWTVGRLTLQGSKLSTHVLENYKLKLDLVDHNILFIDPNTNDSMLVDKNLIGQVDLMTPQGIQSFIFLDNPNIRAKNPSVTKFHKVIFNGKWKLLESYLKYAIESAKSGLGGATEPGYYQEENAYWIVSPQGKIEKVSLKKSRALEIFADKKTEILDFIAKTGLTLKKPEEWAKLMQYYETLSN